MFRSSRPVKRLAPLGRFDSRPPPRGENGEGSPLDAMLRSSLAEGPISHDLRKWKVPCLIYAGAEDEMHENAARSASEIPGAVFVSLPGHTHFSAEREAEELLRHVLQLFRSAAP
jgi:pimeloyl-ACP methyl ester carboxylesterase